MRGMLSFQILWLLSKRAMNGQELCCELERRRGSRPTPGTIYPALKGLRMKGLVMGKRQGRGTVYVLTDPGRRELDGAFRYFCKAFGEIIQEYSAGKAVGQAETEERKGNG